MTTSSYEFHTVHIQSNEEDANNFVGRLIYPLKDVVQVSVLMADMNTFSMSSKTPDLYLSIEELQSQFNQIAGNVQSDVIGLPYNLASIKNPLAVFPVSDERTRYLQNDYSTQTQFITPIRKLERLTCKIYDINGDLATLNVHTLISLRFTCLRSNLCPEPPKRKNVNINTQ
jgi:hypothetical protein